MHLLFLAALLAQSAAPAPVAGPPQTTTVSPVVLIAAQPDKPKAQDPDTLVCRNEPVLGSRFSVKRCSTARQMAMEKLDAQQELAKAQAKDGFHH